MKSHVSANDPNTPLHQALAEFRHQLRTFLLTSEEAAHRAGLHPQQHQLILAVAGAPANTVPTIAYAAERMGLKHNTAVELVDRCESEGLLRRESDPEDGRRVCLRVTARGRKVLEKLSYAHLRELNFQGPKLISALRHVLQKPRSRRHGHGKSFG